MKQNWEIAYQSIISDPTISQPPLRLFNASPQGSRPTIYTKLYQKSVTISFWSTLQVFRRFSSFPGTILNSLVNAHLHFLVEPLTPRTPNTAELCGSLVSFIMKVLDVVMPPQVPHNMPITFKLAQTFHSYSSHLMHFNNLTIVSQKSFVWTPCEMEIYC